MTVGDLIKVTILPELTQAGFRKKGLCWNRERTSLIDVFTVQASKGSSSGNLQFTINAGVFVPQFYEMVWGQPATGTVQDADCVLRIRIGPNSGGDWWNITSESAIDEIRLDLKSRFLEFALPFWDRIATFDSLYVELRGLGDWRKQHWLTQLYTAIAAHFTGDSAFAFAILDEICQSRSSLAAKARSVASSLTRADEAKGVIVRREDGGSS